MKKWSLWKAILLIAVICIGSVLLKGEGNSNFETCVVIALLFLLWNLQSIGEKLTSMEEKLEQKFLELEVEINELRPTKKVKIPTDVLLKLEEENP